MNIPVKKNIANLALSDVDTNNLNSHRLPATNEMEKSSKLTTVRTTPRNMLLINFFKFNLRTRIRNRSVKKLLAVRGMR